jgi:hypothetical protein
MSLRGRRAPVERWGEGRSLQEKILWLIVLGFVVVITLYIFMVIGFENVRR